MSRRRKLVWTFLGVSLTLLVLVPLGRHLQLRLRLEHYQAELKAQGRRLDLAGVMPAYQTNGPNGAFALSGPLMRLGTLPLLTTVSIMSGIAPGKARVAWQQTHLHTDHTTNLWPFLETLMETNREHLVELRQVLADCRTLDFRPDYQAGPLLQLPHLSRLRSGAIWLANAAVYELHAGRAEVAFENLRAGAQMAWRYDREPLLISQLVRGGLAQINLNATWEALQGASLSENQWQELQQIWEQMDFTTAWAQTFDMERALGSSLYARLRENPALFQSLYFHWNRGSPNAPPSVLDMGKEWTTHFEEKTAMLYLQVIWPYWASYREELAALQLGELGRVFFEQSRRHHAFLPALTRADPAPILGRNGRDHGFSPFFSDSSFANQSQYLKRFGAVETARRLLLTALALKRYHLRHGGYPEALTALLPDFLSAPPVDFMDGKPLRYRLLPGAGFQLYSVGENGLDDNGKPSSDTGYMLLRGADWVWPQPASAAEVAADNKKFLQKIRAREH